MILECACQQGEGLVYEYAFDGKVVVVELCLRRDATLVVLKTTYDENIKMFSPAFLLRQEEIDQLFTEKHIKRMEFFGKVMEWHTRWTDKKRTLYHLTVFRHKWLRTYLIIFRNEDKIKPFFLTNIELEKSLQTKLVYSEKVIDKIIDNVRGFMVSYLWFLNKKNKMICCLSRAIVLRHHRCEYQIS